MDIETITENSWDIVFEKMSESPLGITVLCILAVVVTLLPLWKWLYSIYKDKKEELDKKKEQKRKDEEEMKQSIKTIAKHLPELDQQVLSLSNEVASFKSLKEEWMDTSKTLQTTVHEIQDNLKDLSEKSKSDDKRISDKLEETQSLVSDLSKSTKKIETDMGVLFEGENNEFRIYLTQLHARYVHGNEHMTREVRQSLRIKFDSYDKRGGNGWAKELYLELMALPVTTESMDLLDDIQ